MYCATKAFTSFLAEGLHYEVKDKCDVLSWEPLFVETKMSNKKAGDSGSLTTQYAVKEMHKHIGKEIRTPGNPSHALQTFTAA